MIAVSGGSLIALSTPWGKRGWFYEEWESADNTWERVKITADQCPRISAEFLEQERRSLGEHWYLQEYFTEFRDVIDSVFNYDDVMAAKDDDLTPLFVFGKE